MKKPFAVVWVGALILAVPAVFGAERKVDKAKVEDCLKFLQTKDPEFKGSIEFNIARVLDRIQVVGAATETHFKVEALPETTRNAMKTDGKKKEFQDAMVAYYSGSVPGIVETNTGNMSLFTKELRKKCEGIDTSTDKEIAKWEERLEPLIESNPRMAKRVEEEVREKMAAELFNPDPAFKLKPFPFEDPDRAQLRVTGYLTQKFKIARNEILDLKQGGGRVLASPDKDNHEDGAKRPAAKP